MCEEMALSGASCASTVGIMRLPEMCVCVCAFTLYYAWRRLVDEGRCGNAAMISHSSHNAGREKPIYYTIARCWASARTCLPGVIWSII